MEVVFTEYVPILDDSSVGEARRRGLLLAERLGFEPVQSGEFALLITEVTRNILAHAQSGQTILEGVKNEHSAVARIVAMDKGPGIADITRAMDDGYSTAGTPGNGMGAMKRIASKLEIFTGPSGTIVLLEVGAPKQPGGLQLAGMAIPYPGERVCGDGWSYHQTPERTVVFLVDGLGHGRHAAEASEEAVAVFRKHVAGSPAEILSYVHDGMRKTRGGVAAVAEIRPQEKTLTYAGVGNIAAVILSRDQSRSLVSHNGTLGLSSPRMQEFRVDWPEGAILIMHSDGLTSRWDLSSYAGLLARHPAIIGAALFRDFWRHRDDASVVVIKSAV